jgi:hypothetical protein
MKKQIGFLLMVMLFITALAFMGCPTDGDDKNGGEGDAIPATLALGTAYTGTISGTIEKDTNEGCRYEKTYNISGATFAEGDFIKVSFTIGEGASTFNQVNIAVNLDAYGYKGSRDGSWGNTASGTARESYIQTVKTWTDNEGALTTDSTKGVGDQITLPQTAALRIRFKTGGSNQDSFTAGEAVSVHITNLKVEKVTVTPYTLTFKANGGVGSDTAVTVYDAPDYNIVPTEKIPGFTQGTNTLIGWGTTTTATMAEKVDLSQPVTASGNLFAIWGSGTLRISKGTLTVGTAKGLNEFAIPLEWLGDGSNGSELEIEITAPEKTGDGQTTGYYPGDGWGFGKLMDGVDGWGDDLGLAFTLDTPNPGPATVDGKKTFSLKFTVADILTALSGKTTTALKVNAYNGFGSSDSAVTQIAATIYLITY